MDFSLSEEQRGWQMKAREFADTEISKISLQRDTVAIARETFDWNIIKKGSKIGFRNCRVREEPPDAGPIGPTGRRRAEGAGGR